MNLLFLAGWLFGTTTMASTTTTTTKQVTPMEILLHRKTRKESGMVGCITGKPEPEINFYGFSDVQIWYLDANGRMNGDPEFNRMDPYCFCFDCRDAFDPKAEIDTQLVNQGHERACWVYASLLGKTVAGSEGGTQPSESNTNPRCEDCREADATTYFIHLDGRSFDLCETCFAAADHDDFYLAHVKAPNLRVGSHAASVYYGLSNESSSQETHDAALPTRSNGGGIQIV